jgi:hypothetical protein
VPWLIHVEKNWAKLPEGHPAGGPAFELSKLPMLWVPRSSRSLRRAGTMLPTA